MNPYIVYDMVDVINKTATCPVALKEELTRALYAGSSGLEILDGIAHVFRDPQYQIFYERLVDMESLEMEIFNKRKEFMDLEYPCREGFKSLTHFDSNWCQCPSCGCVWEDGGHKARSLESCFWASRFSMSQDHAFIPHDSA